MKREMTMDELGCTGTWKESTAPRMDIKRSLFVACHQSVPLLAKRQET